MFNERKVSHRTAYFLLKENCQMAHLKLMKLLYLADRTLFDISQFGLNYSYMNGIYNHYENVNCLLTSY
jgi:hypothetical protein